MWKTLRQGENVSFGDKLRYTGISSKILQPVNIFEVVKIEQHYFEVAPVSETGNSVKEIARRVVKYFDIGSYIKIEVWSKEETLTHQTAGALSL